MKHIKIKKELTQDQFRELFIKCEKEFSQIKNFEKIALEFIEQAKIITPATEIYILTPNQNKKIFEIIFSDKHMPMNTINDSLLMECYKTKQSFIVNDATRSLLYSKKMDAILGIKPKDLLLIPIMDNNNNIIAIIWMATLSQNWNQFTSDDLNYMIKFSELLKRFWIKDKNISVNKADDLQSTNLMEINSKLKAQMKLERDYFATIIHDIRTPMNAVLGFLELLHIDETDDKKKEYIYAALKSGETMITLINDALDISKISNGELKIEKISFSPIDELSDVAKLFYNTAKKKNILFRAFFDPNIPKEIYSDYHRIKQITNNLLSNALKFTPEGGIITMDITYNENQDTMTVSVQDTGIGISEDMQKNIFTPYVQESESTARKYGGTGLGLSISSRLAVLLGGKLDLESKKGKGSRFYFTLPCNTPDKTVKAITRQTPKIKSAILCVSEQSKNTLETVKKYMNAFDIETTEYKTGSESKTVLSKKFDLIIISTEDAENNNKNLEKILKKNIPAIIVGRDFLEKGYYKIAGNVERINKPILPHNIYNAIAILEGNKKVKKTKELIRSHKEILKNKISLVVDDNPINLKFMKESLKIIGLQTTITKNAQEAVELTKNNKFDIIFMDKNMPEMQGEQVIGLIRENEKTNKKESSVIIGLTGDADKKTANELINSGADAVLTKPIQIKKITETVIKYLS